MAILESIKNTWHAIKRWTWHHVVVFLLTFFAYAAFHACRKAFSNIKDSLQKTWTPDNATYYPYETWQKVHVFENEHDADVFLGELDTLFLFAYAVGLFIFGVIGDRVNLRLMLSGGMCGSAILTFLFGYVGPVFNIHNLWYYRIFYFLNGFCQATGWPASVAVMGNWFSKSSGGLVFGFWSSNASTGNIFGSLIVASVLHYGLEYGMLLNSIFLFCFGIIILVCLVIHPNDVGLESPDDESERDKSSINGEVETLDEAKEIAIKQPTKAVGFFEAFLIPGVIPYALSYACIKLVNYTFFFWLPTYLSQGLNWKDDISDKLSNFYDIGGIVGGIIAGIITDIMGVRSPIVCLMLVLSTGSLYLYNAEGDTYTRNVSLMILTGFLIGGPANTISTAITADLGKHEKIKGNAEALATVTGIIDGTGSIGAAIGQYLVGVIDKNLGWHWVFYFLIIMTGLSFLCIIPMLIKDLKSLFSRGREAPPPYSPLPTAPYDSGCDVSN